MPYITRCCCCCDLRRGSITSSFYSMISAALTLGTSAYMIHVNMQGTWLEAENNTFLITTCVDVAFFSLLFVLSILLLYGIKQGKRKLFIPYLVCMTILVILQAILILLLIIIMVTSIDPMVVFELIISGLITSINVYCILCVVSYYQELRDGRAGMRAVYRAQGSMLPHVESPPEKSGDLNTLENANFVPPYPGPPMAAPDTFPGAELEAPPPYQPPEYPAQTYPRAEVQTA